MSGQNYAVLFSGGGGARGNNSRYYRTLKDVYTTLVEQHDFSPENITLLYADAGLGDTNINTRYNETSSEQFKFLKKSVANTDLVDELNDYYPARKKLGRSIKVNAKNENKIKDIVEEINQSESVYLEFSSRRQAGEEDLFLVDIDLYGTSDFSFARKRGSTVTSANSQDLEHALTNREGSQGLLNNITQDDHFLFWAFDHGDYAGPMDKSVHPKVPYGIREYGNKSVLNGWRNDITTKDFVEWATPIIEQSTASTFVFNQCFSGGFVEELSPVLEDFPNAYAMAAANGYEVSYSSAFADAINKTLMESNPLASNLFGQAKENDSFAFRGTYGPNQGDTIPGKEHPWAFPSDGGEFKVFTGTEQFTSAINTDIKIKNQLSKGMASSVENILLTTKEDKSINIERDRDWIRFNNNKNSKQDIVSITQPTSGTLKTNQRGEIIYQPLPDFSGTDNFFVKTSNDKGKSEWTSLKVNVNEVNDLPVAIDDTIFIEKNSKSVAIKTDDSPGFLDDFDIDNDELFISSFSNPKHGELKLIDDNFFYTPPKNYTGKDSFLYEISDGEETDAARVSITVEDNYLKKAADGTYKLLNPDGSRSKILWEDGSYLSEDKSEKWDVIDTARTDNGFLLLAKYHDSINYKAVVLTKDERDFWGMNVSNSPTDRLSGDTLEAMGYENLFGIDLNNDGAINDTIVNFNF